MASKKKKVGRPRVVNKTGGNISIPLSEDMFKGIDSVAREYLPIRVSRAAVVRMLIEESLRVRKWLDDGKA